MIQQREGNWQSVCLGKHYSYAGSHVAWFRPRTWSRWYSSRRKFSPAQSESTAFDSN